MKKLKTSSPDPEYKGLDQPNSSDPLEEELWEEHNLLNTELDFDIEEEEDSDESMEDTFNDPKDDFDYPQFNVLKWAIGAIILMGDLAYVTYPAPSFGTRSVV